MDELIIVFLIKDNYNGQNSILRCHKEISEICPNVDFQCMTFGMLIEHLFGEDEFLKFQNAMDAFRNEANKIIGYQLTEVLNDDNILKLKNQTKTELLEFPYDDFNYSKKIKYGIDLKKFHYIKNSFINEHYKLLLGKKDFAESFLTSEWLYKNYTKSKELDNTFIVAGYLKSIEQLLWNILRLKGCEDKFKKINDYGEEIILNTLGNLEFFLKNHNNINIYSTFLENDVYNVQRYLKKVIKHWRKNYRNGYFHKDNINDENNIKTIREETYFLYMLILGSLDLSDVNFENGDELF